MRPALPPGLLRLPIAHRALHDRTLRRPENSLAAVRAAVEAGYAIEIDLQPSADGVAMVFHDPTLDRLTAETGPVNTRSAAALQAIGLRDADEGIPTLAQVLATIDGRVPLLIEIKDQSGCMGPTDGRLEAAAAADLAGYRGEVAVMSFNPSAVAHMQRLAPAIPRGLTTYSFPADDFPPDLGPDMHAHLARLAAITDFDPVGASFISHYRRELDAPRVADLLAQGWPVLCWTVKKPAQEVEARRIAHNITFEGYLAPFV